MTVPATVRGPRWLTAPRRRLPTCCNCCPAVSGAGSMILPAPARRQSPPRRCAASPLSTLPRRRSAAGLWAGGWWASISARCAANLSWVSRAQWTFRRSRIRTTLRPVSRIRRPRKRIKSGPSPCYRPPSSADLRLLCGAEKPPRTRLRPARAALGCEVSRGRRAFRNCRPGTRPHHSRSLPRSTGDAASGRLRECHGAVAGAARARLPRGTATEAHAG